MDVWNDARIDRLESRIDRIERKEWERRDRIFRMIVYGFIVAMIVLNTVLFTLAATHH